MFYVGIQFWSSKVKQKLFWILCFPRFQGLTLKGEATISVFIVGDFRGRWICWWRLLRVWRKSHIKRINNTTDCEYKQWNWLPTHLFMLLTCYNVFNNFFVIIIAYISINGYFSLYIDFLYCCIVYLINKTRDFHLFLSIFVFLIITCTRFSLISVITKILYLICFI